MKTITKTHAPGFRLRWKKTPRDRGWHDIRDASFTLTDANGTRFAMVQHHRTGGWFWVAGWEGREHGVQHKNTASEAPLETEADAKAAALAYVKAALAKVGP